MAAFQIGLFILVWALFSEAHAGPITSDLKPIHAVNRLAFGPSPGELQRVKAIGIEEYLKEQLSPELIALPSRLTARLTAFSTLGMTPVDLFAEYNPPPSLKKRTRKRPGLPNSGRGSSWRRLPRQEFFAPWKARANSKR